MADGDEIRVREMGAEGAALFSEIHEQCFNKLNEQHWTKQDFEELLKIRGTVGMVVSRGDFPVGFSLVRIVLGEAEIITFCILPKWCNNGYASILLEQIIKMLQKQSVSRLFLEVRENNRSAIGLYKKYLFEIIARREGYYNSSQCENTDALVMQRELDV